MSFRAVASKDGVTLLLLLLLPIIGNVVSVFLNVDPTLQLSEIGLQLRGGLFSGPPGWVDPSVGYIIQPIGYLAASDWLHGIVPWWNPYAGAGMPLAAESQTEAFFLPFSLLLHFNAGWLVLRVILQQCCGIILYIFLKQIGLARSAAFMGGVLFEFTPEFYLCPSAPIAPLPFLPLLLLGIERAAKAASQRKHLGWSLIVIACAYSLYAGNPEVAYFNGLLCGLWAIWLFFQLQAGAKVSFAGKLVIGIAIAVGLSAPLLIPASEYAADVYLGPHTGYFKIISLPRELIPLQLFPDLYGFLGAALPPTLKQNLDITRLPGWTSLPILALVLAGFFRKGPLPRFGLRLLLLGWVLIWEARYLGIQPVQGILNLFPGIAVTDAARYSGPSVDVAIILLAAFGVDDYLRMTGIGKARLFMIAGCLVILSIAAITPGISLAASVYSLRPGHFLFGGLDVAIAAILAIVVLVNLQNRRRSGVVLCCVLAFPLFSFVIPQFSGLSSGKLDVPLVNFLKQNIGTNRMASFGPFGLNFPDKYGITSVNYNALPSPSLWANEVHASLDPESDLNSFDANGIRNRALSYLPAYEADGVKYAVFPPGSDFSRQSFDLVQAGQRNLAHALFAGTEIAGDITEKIPFQSIGAVSILIGTYRGAASGPLLIQICSGASDCVEAGAELTQAQDNEPLILSFNHPLQLNGEAISYRITHPSGRAVAVWFAPNGAQKELPALQLLPPWPAPIKGLVYQDQVASVFELSDPKPYAEAVGTGCEFNVFSRNHIQADCSRAGNIIRREMFDPGWIASVNGHSEQVRKAGLFQLISVEAGANNIILTYAPLHIGLACLLAFLALFAWFVSLFAALRSKRML